MDRCNRRCCWQRRKLKLYKPMDRCNSCCRWQISKIWSSPSPDPCRPIDAYSLGWVWGFFTFYNYRSRWIDAIDIVVGSQDEGQVGTWQSLPELEIDPGDFLSDSSWASTPTINQDSEGEVHSEVVSTNVESPHDATRVNRVTFSDEQDDEI